MYHEYVSEIANELRKKGLRLNVSSLWFDYSISVVNIIPIRYNEFANLFQLNANNELTIHLFNRENWRQYIYWYIYFIFKPKLCNENKGSY